MREAIAQLWFGPGYNNVFPDIKQFFPVFGRWSGFNHNKRHSLAAQRPLKLRKDTYSHAAPGVASKYGTEFG